MLESLGIRCFATPDDPADEGNRKEGQKEWSKNAIEDMHMSNLFVTRMNGIGIERKGSSTKR